MKQHVKLHSRKKDFVSLCRIVLCGAAEKAYIFCMAHGSNFLKEQHGCSGWGCKAGQPAEMTWQMPGFSYQNKKVYIFSSLITV
jgi:hypothetical protein